MAATITLSDFRQRLAQIDFRGISIPFVVLLIISMLVLPLPAFLLDVLFTFNIMIGLIIIMIAINTTKPLEFSVYFIIGDLTALGLERGLNPDCFSEWSRRNRRGR
jgi:flagellar biosynthesis component FlhA